MTKLHPSQEEITAFEVEWAPFFEAQVKRVDTNRLAFGWRPEHDRFWFKLKDFIRRRIFRLPPKRDDPRYYWTAEECEEIMRASPSRKSE